MLEIKREKHTIDAAGKVPGRLASEIAPLLIGKNRPDYMPNVDKGARIIVENASKMKISGKKMDQKIYYSHSMYPGGLKEVPMKRIWEKDPGDVLRRAVSRMLPKNKLRTGRMNRLTIKN